MKIEKIDFKYETILYYVKKIKKNDVDNDLITKFNELGDEKVNYLFENYLEFKKVIDKDAAEIDFKYYPYLEVHPDNQNSILANFYIYNQIYGDLSIEEVHKYYYIDMLNDIDGIFVDEINLELLVNVLNKGGYSDSYKIMLITFYTSGISLYKSFINDISSTVELLRKNYYMIENDINNFYKNELNKEQFSTRINNLLGTNYENSNNFVVYPTIFNYNQVIVNSFKDKECTYFWVGYMWILLFEIKNARKNEEQKVITVLKIISDPTRFKILKLLNKKPMYNQELAGELNLTSATLNHHINILLNESLITFDINNQDKKKIFYRLTDGVIEKLINNLREEFL